MYLGWHILVPLDGSPLAEEILGPARPASGWRWWFIRSRRRGFSRD